MADNILRRSLPPWCVAGVLGIAVGAGGAALVMERIAENRPPPADDASASRPQAPMMMGGGGGFGGGGGPSPVQLLVTQVRQIALLESGRLTLDLGEEQNASLLAALEGIEHVEELTDEEAQARLDAIDQALTDDQRVALGLFRLAPGGSGGGGAAPATAADGSVRILRTGSERGSGSGPPDPPANPFEDEAARTALENLRSELAAGG